MMHYINFANEKFESQQSILLNKYKSFGFDVTGYSPSDIDEVFKKENDKVLSSPVGFGYWLWKPYFILRKLNEVNDNDIVFYTDCGDDIAKDITPFLLEVLKDTDFFIVQHVYYNYRHTKKDCYVLMDCDEPKYYESLHMEAGVCGFRKNEQTIKFVTDWLNYCKDYRIISDENSISDHKEYLFHRHDQSVLSNLVIKNNIKTIDIVTVSEYIHYNKF